VGDEPVARAVSAWIAPLHVVAQPIVSLQSGALIGVEVLTRIAVASGPSPRPDQYWATVSAVEPAAVRRLDRWVWREARRYVRDAGRAFVNTTPVSVTPPDAPWDGLSPASTACELPHPGLVPAAGWDALAAYQRAGGWVVWDAARPDDPWDTPVRPNVIKIGRTWSHGIARSNPSAASVARWMAAAHAAGAHVVALGVERAEDAAWFARHGADWGQGYYWGAPQGLGGFR
jgi:EAL domain-containing protein (putative c-di-GMP-specific phosphodiesterase class I)